MLQLLSKYYNSLNHCIYHGIILIAVIAGVIRFKKLSPGSRIFLLLLLLTPVIELLAYYCAVNYHDNRFIYNPFNILQFALICLAFYADTRLRSIAFIFASFIVFVIINNAFYQPLLSSSNSNSFLVEQLLVIILYFMFLVHYFKKADQGTLAAYPLFWIGLGWLLFSITAIVAFGLGNIIVNGSNWDAIFTWVKKIANYFLYLSFLIAFLSPQKSLNDITGGK